MNNVEALEDFLKLLKEVHPNTQISERDKLLLGMAINHAYLIKRDEITELKKGVEFWKDLADSCECNN